MVRCYSLSEIVLLICIDIELDSLPPKWMIDPKRLIVENGTYDVKAVPISSIVRVCNRLIKVRLLIAGVSCLISSPQVDVDMIVERSRISVMSDVVEQLNGIAQEWGSNQAFVVPEVDWSKMRQLEFQENLRSRNALETRLHGKSCILCQEFDEHVRVPSELRPWVDS